MNDRYPHLRFLIDASPVLAGGLALVVFLGGTMRACHHGGGAGLISFLLVAVLAVFVYLIVRAKLELLQAVLDLEGSVRDLNEMRRDGTVTQDPHSPGV